MATTTANALKAFIESLGLGITAHRDRPPKGTDRPYVTIIEAIADVPDDTSDGGSGVTTAETVQIDVWETWKADSGGIAESFTLAQTIARALHGSRLLTSGSGALDKTVYGVRVLSRRRIPDPDANVVHNAITATVHRNL